MNIGLSKSEILTLRQTYQQSSSMSELARRLEVKPSFISRVVRKLEAKGLVQINKVSVKILDMDSEHVKGAVLLPRAHFQKLVFQSMASHAQYFKDLADSRPEGKIENWLSGYAIDILISVDNGAQKNDVLKEAGCSPTTLNKSIKLMQTAGVLTLRDNFIQITDQLLKRFVLAYADNFQGIIQREMNGHNTSIRVRKHVVLRTDAKNIPPVFFTKTGASALAERGLEAFLTSYDDFYFNLDRKKRTLSIEENFIHALLLTTIQQHQDMPVLTIFFTENRQRLDFRSLRNLAKLYKVENALIEVRGKTEFYEKMKENVAYA